MYIKKVYLVNIEFYTVQLFIYKQYNLYHKFWDGITLGL